MTTIKETLEGFDKVIYARDLFVEALELLDLPTNDVTVKIVGYLLDEESGDKCDAQLEFVDDGYLIKLNAETPVENYPKVMAHEAVHAALAGVVHTHERVVNTLMRLLASMITDTEERAVGRLEVPLSRLLKTTRKTKSKKGESKRSKKK